MNPSRSFCRFQPPADKQAGKRGGKGSSTSSSTRRGATSRDANAFDAMIAGLIPTHPPPGEPPSASDAMGRCNAIDTGQGFCSTTATDIDARNDPADALLGACEGKKTAALACTAPTKVNAIIPDGADSTPTVHPIPPHPVYGCRKPSPGGGGGKLVEALRPLISGNARSWLVVSVGGGGRGGPGAAWRAMDVARQATGIGTTCIRLR